MNRVLPSLGVSVGLLTCCTNVDTANRETRSYVVTGLHNAGYPTVGEVSEHHYNWGPDLLSAQITIGACVAKDVIVVPINDLWVPATPEYTSGGSNKQIPEPSIEAFKADFSC